LAALKQARRDRGEQEEDEDDPEATVYRDASGKRIDVKLAKAEKAKEKRAELEQQMKKMEWGKGLVQKGEVEEKKREAERLKMKGIAR
jgi:pre-mRNA-splicing factor CWC26